MSSIETMSHVELLELLGPCPDCGDGISGAEYERARAEVLRRMDSARTSSRDEIEPDKDGYQR